MYFHNLDGTFHIQEVHNKRTTECACGKRFRHKSKGRRASAHKVSTTHQPPARHQICIECLNKRADMEFKDFTISARQSKLGLLLSKLGL